MNSSLPAPVSLIHTLRRAQHILSGLSLPVSHRLHWPMPSQPGAHPAKIAEKHQALPGIPSRKEEVGAHGLSLSTFGMTWEKQAVKEGS